MPGLFLNRILVDSRRALAFEVGAETPTRLPGTVDALIHALFDAAHLRIRPDGTIDRSDGLKTAVSYKSLPRQVELPAFVNREALAWRLKYT